MRARDLVVYATIGAVVLATAAVLAVAQTDPGDESARVQIAQARAPRGGGAPGGARPGGAGRPDFAAMLRERLVGAGATPEDVQAIEAYRTKQREIMQPLMQAMGALREAAGAEATDAQAKDAVAVYEAAMKTALDALAKAEADLKTKLNLAAKPKLHAMLLMMGTLDNGMRGGGMRGGFRGGRGAAGAAGRGGAGGGRGGARGGGGAPPR